MLDINAITNCGDSSSIYEEYRFHQGDYVLAKGGYYMIEESKEISSNVSFSSLGCY